MKIGIVGLAQSGKTTLFNALTGAQVDTSFSGKTEAHRAIVNVPDERLDQLAAIFQPKKTTPAIIEYIDLSGIGASEQKKSGFSDQFLGQIRLVDAILVLVRAFENDAIPHPLNSLDPLRDLHNVEAEFIISDLSIVENRMDRLQRQMKSKKSEADAREYALLEKCKAFLEEEKPLRHFDMTPDEQMIVRGYQFLTQKPLIIVVNVGESDIANPEKVMALFADYLNDATSTALAISAQIEMEIQQLSQEEAELFQSDLGITESAMARLIRASYDLLGLISFLTAGEDECRAWTIRQNTKAPQAAGAIHTDFERGFIRAEIVHYDDFIQCKSLPQCKTDGVMRLEGKEYVVKDGDMIHFRFAV